MRIIFIEDEKDSIEPVRDLCREQLQDFTDELSEFEDAESNLRRFQPDIVVLDIARGSPAEGDTAGLITYDFIWKHQFCPIVVYSARPDLLDEDQWPPHPFVKKVQKGSGSPSKVLAAIQEFLPHVQALQKTQYLVRDCFSMAMRHIAPYAFTAFDDITKREEVILRSGRRRIAALMDESPMGESGLASWECYLYPPALQDTQLGDILQLTTGKSASPSSFRVVLTPSCDMVQSNGRKPKVQKILAAKCCSMPKALSLLGLPGTRNVATIMDRILSSGYAQAIIPLPSLKGLIPLMAANLRDLELISIANIADEKRFVRIASIDSPFRELIAWAYMQTACRPGLPDRDLESWAQEIISTG